MLILGLQAKCYEALRSKKKSTLTGDILELGSYNNLAQLGKCLIFFFKNHSTLLHKNLNLRRKTHNKKIMFVVKIITVKVVRP